MKGRSMLGYKVEMVFVIWCLVMVLVFLAGCGGDDEAGVVEKAEAPRAAVESYEVEIHGETRVDNYYWLREREDPKVTGYLEAENRYTRLQMERTNDLQNRLYGEMVGRIKEDDETAPVKMGDYFYYERTEKGKQYVIHCRKKDSPEGAEEVLLDENALAQGQDYFRVGAFKVSDDHRLLAYGVDANGSEVFTIYVKDLATGELRGDVIKNGSAELEWGSDNRTFFYTTPDAAKRPFKLYRHVLGSEAADDVLAYHEEDQAYKVRLSRSKSRGYLFMTLKSNTTTEVRFLKADGAGGEFRVIQPRQQGVEYYVEHNGSRFFIRCNEGASNFKLMEAPAANPGKANWTDVVGHREEVLVEGMEVFANYVVLLERSKGIRQVRVMNLGESNYHYVEFEEPVYAVWAGENPDYNSEFLRFNYSSLVTPGSVYDYHLNEMWRKLVKRDEVAGYDPEGYTSERIMAPAGEGTEAPISLVYKKGMVRNGANPLVLYGYGSYGISMEPSFSANRLSLLDRGFVYAIAHIRGGSEMGRAWYDQGKLLHKRNTFMDFIACAEHLIEKRYTSREKLAIMGGSAGGLLMGAAVNMRPELFQAVVAKAPFVDVVNTMLDASIPLTVNEYEEWGNPKEKAYYDYMMTYSPYDNVAAQEYPALLITAGWNDPRVPYWEPAKWAAKLRATKRDNNLLLLKTNMEAGHGGASGRYDYLKEVAFEYAFIFKGLGIRE